MSLCSFWLPVKWFQLLLYNRHNLTSIICLNTVCYTSPIDRALSGTTTLGQNESGSNGNEGVLFIPQSSSINGALPSDCLVSYIQETHWSRVPTPLQMCSRCILWPKSTGLIEFWSQLINIKLLIIKKK